MQLSKSDYMMFLRHPAWLWLKKNDKDKLPKVDENLQAIFDTGHEFEQYAEKYPLYAYLMPSYLQNENGQTYPAQTARIGVAAIKDTARINHMLRKAKDVFPRDLRLVWSETKSSKTKYVGISGVKS